jgi:thiamine-phosphate pyrophosphorylase
MRSPRILLITDAAFADDAVLRAIETVGEVAPPGTFAVQLRDRAKTGEERAAWARLLRERTRARHAALVVNGDLGLARAVGADGVHFGAHATQESIAAAAGFWRSVAAHTDDDVAAARQARVDAVLVSPVFESPGKGPPRGVAALERAVTIADGQLAVIALGGVGASEARACFDAGAHGVAAIRALLCAVDPASAARAMLDAAR